MNFVETQIATCLHTFVEDQASTNRQPERRRLSGRTLQQERFLQRHSARVHLHRCVNNTKKTQTATQCFQEVEASTFLRTFVEAPVCLRPECLRQLQVRAHMHLQRSVALQEVEASTLLHTFAEAPTQRQPERRQLQRRRLSARTPSFNLMPNMMNKYVRTFAKMKVVVRTPYSANVFNY